MRIDDLAKAVALRDEMKQWQDAAAHCNPNVFKHAILRVANSAHGHQGQSAETTINLTSDQIRPFIVSEIQRITAAIRALGIEV